MTQVLNLLGKLVNYNSAVMLMDNELREKLHRDFKGENCQDFFTQYENAHCVKFGEIWELSKSNPQY